MFERCMASILRFENYEEIQFFDIMKQYRELRSNLPNKYKQCVYFEITQHQIEHELKIESFWVWQTIATECCMKNRTECWQSGCETFPWGWCVKTILIIWDCERETVSHSFRIIERTTILGAISKGHAKTKDSLSPRNYSFSIKQDRKLCWSIFFVIHFH